VLTEEEWQEFLRDDEDEEGADSVDGPLAQD
jgi:hypothetical protein